MNDEIYEFIEREKSISRFKLEILKGRLKDSVSSDSAEVEDRFVKYDFSKVRFSSIEECRLAVDLFRRSFELFEQKYADKKYTIDYEDIYSDILNQINSVKAEENLIDGFFIPNVSNRKMYNKDDTLRNFVYKITLKQKILLNCIIRCFKNLEDYGDEYNYEDLEFFFSGIERNIYRYYNESFEILKSANLICEKEFSKFRKLEDAIVFFDKVINVRGKIFLKLDLNHSGYEKINPLFITIKNENEAEINNSHKFKVILEKGVYYKAVEVDSAKIKQESSSILIAPTRREMEDFNNLKSWLRQKIKNIKNKIVL